MAEAAFDAGVWCPDCGGLVASHEFYRGGRCPAVVFDHPLRATRQGERAAALPARSGQPPAPTAPAALSPAPAGPQAGRGGYQLDQPGRPASPR